MRTPLLRNSSKQSCFKNNRLACDGRSSFSGCSRDCTDVVFLRSSKHDLDRFHFQSKTTRRRLESDSRGEQLHVWIFPPCECLAELVEMAVGDGGENGLFAFNRLMKSSLFSKTQMHGNLWKNSPFDGLMGWRFKVRLFKICSVELELV